MKKRAKMLTMAKETIRALDSRRVRGATDGSTLSDCTDCLGSCYSCSCPELCNANPIGHG